MHGKNEMSEECLHCPDHNAREERLKILNRIPAMLSWMNFMKGGIALLSLCVLVGGPMLYTSMSNTRSELYMKMKDHETESNAKAEKMADHVVSIERAASSIGKDVAVLVNAQGLQYEQIKGEIAVLRSYHPTRDPITKNGRRE